MSFTFLPADPQPPGGGTLVLTFLQFFYLVNFKNGGKNKTDFKGAVVLLPVRDHFATLNVHGRLQRNQIDLFVAPPNKSPEAMSKGKVRTEPPTNVHLASSKDLFGHNMPLKPGLLSSKPVPSTLAARVVLAGGKMVEDEPSRKNAKGLKWEFLRPGRPTVKRAMTDGMRFELPLVPQHRYWIVVSDGVTPSAAYPVMAGGMIADVANLDPGQHKPLLPGEYEIKSFAMLHDELLVLQPDEHGIVKGFYPGDDEEHPGSAEPICGGEQGDPDPPEDPPDPPNP